MEKYIIGIDGGGTGSKGITAGMEGQILRRFRGGATNYNGGDKAEIDANVDALLEEAMTGRKSGDCRAICIGSAGVGNPDAVSFLKEAVTRKGFTCPVLITADSVTAHAGALNNQDGIVLIAGTGAICFGRKSSGEAMRTGGYGHLIDDEGSAYDIARRMLRAVVRAADGRGDETVLRELIFRQLQVNELGEMIAWLYRKDRSKKEIAYLAVLISKAVENGDAVAKQILAEAAGALVELTVPVIEFFDRKTTIALSGSVLKFNQTVKKTFSERICELYPEGFGSTEGIQIQEAKYEADYGAVLLAMNHIHAK